MAWYDYVPIIGTAYKIFFADYPGQKASDYTIMDITQCCAAFPAGEAGSSVGRERCEAKCKDDIQIQLAGFQAAYHAGPGGYGAKGVVIVLAGSAAALTGKKIIAKVAAGAATGLVVGLILTAVDLGLDLIAW